MTVALKKKPDAASEAGIGQYQWIHLILVESSKFRNLEHAFTL
jgi:hypothetical protein